MLIRLFGNFIKEKRMRRPTHIIIFVHGWSVTNINTYGGLPYRLQEEAGKYGIAIELKEIFLGEYISFDDEIRVRDVARAFQKAIFDKLSPYADRKIPIICITHSTGGPVIREWWNKYHIEKGTRCPISHLIMLAPANFGSGLAKLGKKAISRFMSFLKNVEPGTGILEWLEFGSQESWLLNQKWIQEMNPEKIIDNENGLYPFVITGDYIDRRLYDPAVPFTSEIGSDGVVRAAAANLNARYVSIRQLFDAKDGLLVNEHYTLSENTAPETAFLIVNRKSHSGDNMGIMKSVASASPDPNAETVKAIMKCILIKDDIGYKNLCDEFNEQTRFNQTDERIEPAEWRNYITMRTKPYIHDRYAMIIFRVKDSEGFPVSFYEAILTGGIEGSYEYFPEGFMGKKQKNDNNPGVLTYYLNYDLLHGMSEVRGKDNQIIRQGNKSIDMLGLEIYPYPGNGFVFYKPLKIQHSKEFFDLLIKENGTVMVDITLERMVSEKTFELNEVPGLSISKDFRDKPPTKNAVE